MKSLLSIVLILLTCVLFSQVKPELAIELADKENDYTCNYQNAMITNFNNQTWPGFGNYKTQKIFYYCYTPPSYYSVYMIADDYEISVSHYTKYYIYDEFQNLKYFVYQSEPDGSVVIKFNGTYHQTIQSSDDEILAENMFFTSESDLNSEQILREANDNITHCMCFFDIPNYKEQTEYIRKIFKETISISDLIEKRVGNVIYYYHGKDLIKVIDENDSNREYYIDNGILIFAYYPKTESCEDIRVYFYEEEAYQIIYGKDYISGKSNEFHNYSLEVKLDYLEIIDRIQP